MWYVIGLLIFAILIFAAFTIFRKWADSFVIIAFAIGCACNANFFNAATMPIKCGDIVFGMDAILYVLFLFAIVVKFLHYPVKDGRTVAISSVFAIELSAVIELVANLTSGADTRNSLLKFAIFTISAVASIFATYASAKITKVFQRKKIKNNLTIITAISAGFLIHRFIFYTAETLITTKAMDFNYGWSFLGAIISLVICLILCLLSYWISVEHLVPNEITKMILDNKTSILIRKADDDDAQELSDMIYETFNSRRVQMIYDEADIKTLKAHYTVKNIKKLLEIEHIYVAENDGEIVASAAVEPYEEDKEVAIVSCCYTTPRNQGRGLGRIVLKAIENDEYAVNAKSIRLHALLTSVKYYEKSGYHHLNDEPTIINDRGIQSYVMIKEKEATK